MWNPDVVEVAIAGGRTWRLVFNMRTWRQYETVTHDSLSGAGSSPKSVRALLWALAVQRQPDLLLSDIGRFTYSELNAMVAAGGKAMVSALAGTKPPEAADPTDEPPAATLIDWYELAAFADYDLRIRGEDFWMMSPGFLMALLERWDAAVERHYLASSIVAAAITNCHLKEGADPVDPMIFSPTREGQKVRAQMAKEKRSDLIRKIRGLRNVMGEVREISSGN